MTEIEVVRELLRKIKWDDGLTKEELIPRLDEESIAFSDTLALAIPDDRRYRGPDDLIAALPTSMWRHEIARMTGGLPPESLLPRGRTAGQPPHERTREWREDRPQD